MTVAASRDDTLPILTGVRMEIEGETVTLLATDRYRLAMRDAAVAPVVPRRQPPSPWSAARTLSETAKALGAGGEVTLALASRRRQRADRLRGRRPPARRRLLVDGEYPKVRSLFPPESPTYAVVETAALIEAVKRVALVAERNTPVRLSFTDGSITLEAGTGDDAQASEAVEASLIGDETRRSRSTRSSCSTGSARSTRRSPALLHRRRASPAVLSGQAEADGDDRHVRYRYAADAGPRLTASVDRHARVTGADVRPDLPATVSVPRTDSHARGVTRALGLIGLGKMGGNMRERLRSAGHRGHRLRPQPRRQRRPPRSRTWSRRSPRPARRVGDGAGR